MADRADAADALGDLRHFEIRPAFAEFLQPPELVYVKVGRLHLAAFVEMQGDAGVAFDAGDGLDGDFLGGHDSPPWQAMVNRRRSRVSPKSFTVRGHRVQSSGFRKKQVRALVRWVS